MSDAKLKSSLPLFVAGKAISVETYRLQNAQMLSSVSQLSPYLQVSRREDGKSIVTIVNPQDQKISTSNPEDAGQPNTLEKS